jgi:hypothetical protein
MYTVYISCYHTLRTKCVMKNAIFWDVMQRGSCKNWCFRGTYHLHHQGGKYQQAR